MRILFTICVLHEVYTLNALMLIFAIMNMDESLTLGDIELAEIEQLGDTPNTDDITVCDCNGMCLRENGRKACPCKNLERFCSSACHAPSGSSTCMNKRRSLKKTRAMLVLIIKER